MTEPFLIAALERLRQRIERHSLRLVMLGVAIFVVFFGALALWKYHAFGYNGLDLAIYTQVFHRSAHGDLFGLTIHPHSYLGDHAEFILLLLLPVFLLIPKPETLLILQTVLVASGAIAVFFLGRQRLPKTVALLLALTYLANPTIQNIVLFEFHALPLAIPLLLWTVYAYVRKQFGWFVLLLLVSLAVREDVSLVVIGIGLVALLERRRWYWWVAPLLLGAGWFVTMMRVTAHFSGYGEYKFLRYYAWLGDSIPDILRTVVTDPLRWLRRLGSVRSLELFIGTFLPLVFLPLLRPRWLLPSLPILLQLMLLGASGEILLQIHYPSLILPFAFVSLIFALSAIWKGGTSRFMRFLHAKRVGIALFVPLASLYFALVLGPLFTAPAQVFRGQDREDIALQNAFVERIPKNASLATTFAPLQKTAQRDHLYSLSYVFLGRKQFSEEPYEFPDTDYILIDLDDLIRFDLIYPDNTYRGQQGFERITEVLDRGFSLVAWEDHMTLWAKNGPSAGALVEARVPIPSLPENPIAVGDHLRFLGVVGGSATVLERVPLNDKDLTLLPVSMVWMGDGAMEKPYELAFRLYQDGKPVYEKYYPLASGLLPTSAWEAGTTVRTNYRFRIPSSLPRGTYEARVAVVDLDAKVGVNGLRSIDYGVMVKEALSPELPIGAFVLHSEENR